MLRPRSSKKRKREKKQAAKPKAESVQGILESSARAAAAAAIPESEQLFSRTKQQSDCGPRLKQLKIEPAQVLVDILLLFIFEMTKFVVRRSISKMLLSISPSHTFLRSATNHHLSQSMQHFGKWFLLLSIIHVLLSFKSSIRPQTDLSMNFASFIFARVCVTNALQVSSYCRPYGRRPHTVHTVDHTATLKTVWATPGPGTRGSNGVNCIYLLFQVCN